MGVEAKTLGMLLTTQGYGASEINGTKVEAGGVQQVQSTKMLGDTPQ